MRRTIAILFSAILCGTLAAATAHTMSFDPQVATVQVRLVGNALALPVVELQSDQQLCISFDHLSHDGKNFNYKIVHCNADWTPSNLSENEYIDGFYDGNIDDVALSVSTTTLYTNYQLVLPNNDMRLKISGNYMVLIAENNNFDQLAAQACFSVVDSRATVEGQVRGNTDIELNRRMQQLDFEVNTSACDVRDPFSELKIVVQQNRRADNQVTNLRPTYTSISKQTYKNNPALIFEGGNQYRSIDFSSEYTYGEGIERIVFEHENFHVLLTPSEMRCKKTVAQGEDAHGNYLINRQLSDESATEADYMWVHFVLPTGESLPTGTVYLLGALCGNRLDASSAMRYSFEEQAFVKSLFLKQGGYNFMYVSKSKNSATGSLEPIEGSYWQTENEYTIYVYHRPWGERYDQLVAVETIYSR